MKRGTMAVALALALGTAAAGMAQAETFNLIEDDCGGGCLTPTVTTMGTVTVTDVSGALDFSVTLQNALFNANGNGEHYALSFDVDQTGLSITHLSPTGDFTALTPSRSYSQAGFGDWPDAVEIAGHPRQGSTSNTMTFTVSDAADNLTLADLVSPTTVGGQPIYVVADVNSLASGNTGNVGGVLAPGAVPEPATWAMMILGMGLIGFAARRRRAGLALAAA
jgi:hypothetical protein